MVRRTNAAVDTRRFSCRNYGGFICRNDVGADVNPTALFWPIRCLNAVARLSAAVQVGRLGKRIDGGIGMHKAARLRLFDSGLVLSPADEGGNVCWEVEAVEAVEAIISRGSGSD